MFDRQKALIEKELRTFLQTEASLQPTQFTWSQMPFSGEWGLAIPFFPFAADESRQPGKQVNVPARAAELAAGAAAHLGSLAGFSRLEAVNGYLNLYFSAPEFSATVVTDVLEQGAAFGQGPSKGQRFMVEFSQPNTHKAFHVGHLRNMILGASLANILEFAGYEIVRANYIGDFGRDVIKWLWNYRERHADQEPPEEDITRWMGDLYAEANKQLEGDSTAEDEIQTLFARWEADEPEIHALWQKTRQWSLDGFNFIYNLMGIPFDRIYYESEMERPAKEIVANLVEKDIATDERAEGGPVIVKLDELMGHPGEKYRVLVLMRSDGTSLYGAWDLALALIKFEEYELDRSIYVVDVRQSLHFQQVFKTLELAGYEDKIKKVFHLPYEIVNLPGNVTMSSREGTIVLLEDLIREATQRGEAIVAEKNPDLDISTRQSVAEAVGLAAIKYPMLARENTKTATFDWDSALDFNGQAAPYIQYSHVRANSILRRFAGKFPPAATPTYPLESSEIDLINQISQFGDVVQRAAAEYKTLHITNHAYELARAFNDFYNQCPVLQAEKHIRDFRLCLVAAAKQTLANSLSLLGIEAPEVM